MNEVAVEALVRILKLRIRAWDSGKTEDMRKRKPALYSEAEHAFDE